MVRKLNIDSRVLTVVLFLIAQAVGAVIFGAKLSSEVERLAGVQGKAIPALEAEAKQCGIQIHNNQQAIKEIQEHDKAISGLDVIVFQQKAMSKELENIKEAQRNIVKQHEQIFQMMQQGPMQQSTKGLDYGS